MSNLRSNSKIPIFKMNPKEVFHNTVYSVHLPYIEVVTPFKQKHSHTILPLFICAFLITIPLHPLHYKINSFPLLSLEESLPPLSYNNTPSPPPLQDKFLPSPVTRRVFHLFLKTIPLHPHHYKINSFPLLSLGENFPPLSYNNTPSPPPLQDKFLPSPVTRRVFHLFRYKIPLPPFSLIVNKRFSRNLPSYISLR